MNKQKTKILGLFAGRHDLPAEVQGYVFEGSVDPSDMQAMSETVRKALSETTTLKLYVTGLTAGTVAVCKYCMENLIPLTLMHYDRESGQYKKQVFLSEHQCFTLNHDYGVDYI
mgnify:CR=1 FL=1